MPLYNESEPGRIAMIKGMLVLSWILHAGGPLLFCQIPNSAPAKLVGVAILFETLDDDKDSDSILDIALRDSDRHIIASRFGEGAGVSWRDHTTREVVLQLNE